MKKISILCLCIFATDSFGTDVGLTWYDGDSTITGPTSCTVGGTFLPPTPPARPGYIFTGWHIKEIHEPQIETCGIDQLNTSGRGDAWASISNDGNNISDNSTFGLGLQDNGTWAIRKGLDAGVVYGRALCSDTPGTQYNADTPNNTNGQYCWCQATGYTSTSGDFGPDCTVSPVSAVWVFRNTFEDQNTCMNSCAGYCAGLLANRNASFRTAVYSAVGQ